MEALLKEIWAHPEDDAPRQVLADALTEKNDPLGEFISLQLAYAHGRFTPFSLHRIRELARKHRHRFLAPLAGQVGRGDVTFERGFLAEAHLTDKASLSNPHFHTLTRLNLFYAQLRFSGACLNGLRELSVNSSKVLLDAPVLPSLRRLVLREAASKELKKVWPLLPRVSELRLLEPVVAERLSGLLELEHLQRVHVQLSGAHALEAVRGWSGGRTSLVIDTRMEARHAPRLSPRLILEDKSLTVTANDFSSHLAGDREFPELRSAAESAGLSMRVDPAMFRQRG